MNDFLKDIVPAQSLQIAVSDYSVGRLELTAPLQPNLNDKGTAFAGSISSLLVLAGWGLVTLRLEDAGIQAEVVVSKSKTTYKRPVRAVLQAIAEVSSEQIDQLVSDIKNNQRGAIQIDALLQSNGKRCATMSATYVALPLKGSKPGL